MNSIPLAKQRGVLDRRAPVSCRAARTPRWTDGPRVRARTSGCRAGLGRAGRRGRRALCRPWRPCSYGTSDHLSGKLRFCNRAHARGPGPDLDGPQGRGPYCPAGVRCRSPAAGSRLGAATCQHARAHGDGHGQHRASGRVTPGRGFLWPPSQGHCPALASRSPWLSACYPAGRTRPGLSESTAGSPETGFPASVHSGPSPV